MKSIFYVGATLMIGASIYGFVDYRKASQEKEFNEMYDNKEVIAPEKTTITTEKTEVVIVEKKELVPARKTAEKKSGIKKIEAPSRETKSAIVTTPVERMDTEEITINTPAVKDNGAAEKFKKAKKRKLNRKAFSRAPLREEYENEISLDKPKKLKGKKE